MKNFRKFYKKYKHEAITIFKVMAAVFGIFCIGAFTAVVIEYNYIDLTLGGGIVLGTLVAVCYAISAYKDIKEV